jgi:hypothetical protein
VAAGRFPALGATKRTVGFPPGSAFRKLLDGINERLGANPSWWIPAGIIHEWLEAVK